MPRHGASRLEPSNESDFGEVLAALITRAAQHGYTFAISAGVVGQAWRDGRRQARLARLLGSAGVEIEPLDDLRARAAGQLCGATGTADVIDASVVQCARNRGHRIVTSDPDDIRALEPKAQIVAL